MGVFERKTPALLRFALREGEWDPVLKREAEIFTCKIEILNEGGIVGPEKKKKQGHFVVLLGARIHDGKVWVLIKNSWGAYEVGMTPKHEGASWVLLERLRECSVVDVYYIADQLKSKGHAMSP